MTWAWVQNEDWPTVRAWLERGEWDINGTLEAHVFRKAYLAQWWHTDVVVIGRPQSTAHHTVLDLIRLNIVGLYAQRRDV